VIFTIAWRELRTLFLSPLAWVVFVVVQTLLTFLFLGRLVEYTDGYARAFAGAEDAVGITEYIVPALFGAACTVLVIVVPLLTMRLFAEERRNRTLTLLFSAPASMTEIVLGKYFGALAFMFVILGCLAMLPLSLLLGGPIDLGLLASAMIGLCLVVADFVAVGLFMSAITQYAAVAAIAAFGTLLTLWILDWSGQGLYSGSLLAYLSLANHYIPFLQGLFESSDALYHLLLIATFLVLTIRRLDADRLGA
jgi:ABC-2 type transport system permease protein